MMMHHQTNRSPSSAEKSYDLQYSLPVTRKEKEDPEIPTESILDDGLDDFFTSGMEHIGHPSPFIKDEPEDFSFLSNDFSLSSKGYDMNNQHFGNHAAGNVDPSDLNMHNGSNFNQYGLSGQQHMSNSFNMGNSNIHDEELLEGLDLTADGSHNQFHQVQNGFSGQGQMPDYYTSQGQANNGQTQHMYSNTPDGAPIQSPFNHPNFHYAPNYLHQQQLAHQHMRPNPMQMHGQSLDSGVLNAQRRSTMAPPMDRQGSNSRSPMTPRTPGISALHLSTPESGSLGARPIHTSYGDQRHQKSHSGQWDGNPGSLPSAIESPMGSPGYQPNHAQISDILKSGKHASLPAKVEPHHSGPAYQTQEAKRRRRRESHNQVERRRRDHINEKIHELSELVPAHRLEDEKVRKHLMNNSSLSPTLTAQGISPPQATSLLASGGRRATGSISMGIPPDDKDKGPNKGDILNGAVSWTRDLLWALHLKFEQETQIADYIATLGGSYPFQQTEEEKRMRTELLTVMENNDPGSFSYTRGHGSGLRVPEHTTPAGEPLNSNQAGTISPRSLSPGNLSVGDLGNGQQHWYQNQPTFKEEDEYNMEMS